MTPNELLRDLDPAQTEAVLAPLGPLAILAGAGSGKTRTVTYRIAYGTLTGAWQPDAVLALTHSAQAAAELRERLAALGAGDVAARTFHAAAWRQLRHFWSRTGRPDAPTLLTSTATLVRDCMVATGGGAPQRSAVADMAAELSWAVANRVAGRHYERAVTELGRTAPFHPRLVGQTIDAYVRAKHRKGLVDFDDVLTMTADLLERNPDIAAQVQAAYRHLVVDEYQDVDPAQQRLIDIWTAGAGGTLTVVGDPRQAIYGFKGGSPRHLLDFADRHPAAHVVSLDTNYRSTPQVVQAANRLFPALPAGDAHQAPGPRPVVRAYATVTEEMNAVVRVVRQALDSGTPAAEIAVLTRTNAAANTYSRALAAAGILTATNPVKMFEHEDVLAVCTLLAADADDMPTESGAHRLRVALAAYGWDRETPPAGIHARDRWEMLGALLTIAETLPDAEAVTIVELLEVLRTAADDELEQRPGGVTVLTIHRAKGLEWDTVIVPGLTDGVLPSAQARTPEALNEERCLLYVAMTRARRNLLLAHARSNNAGGRARRSRFLDELTESALVTAE